MTSTKAMVHLVSSAARGRGLAATEALEAGSILFAESPICAHHPSLWSSSSSNDWKRRRGRKGGGKLKKMTKKKREPLASSYANCCPHCFRSDCKGDCLPDTDLTRRYFDALRSSELAALSEKAERDGARQRFPVMVAKAALRCVFCDGERAAAAAPALASTSPSEDAEAAEPTRKVLDFLACPTQAMPPPAPNDSSSSSSSSRSSSDSSGASSSEQYAQSYPPDWVAWHATTRDTALAPLLLEEASSSSSSSSSSSPNNQHQDLSSRQRRLAEEVCSLPFFAATMGRLHLNSMRTTISSSDTGGDGISVGGGGVSVLYGLSSLFNHRCRPNVAPEFDGATVEWRATERVEPGEELFISYTDGRGTTSEGQHQRQSAVGESGGDGSGQQTDDEWLHWNYGFRCSDSCPFCGGGASN